jgi:hypothetical protein
LLSPQNPLSLPEKAEGRELVSSIDHIIVWLRLQEQRLQSHI